MTRLATIDDMESIRSLAIAFVTSFPLESRNFDKAYVELLNKPDACLAVGEANDKIVGYLLGVTHPTSSPMDRSPASRNSWSSRN